MPMARLYPLLLLALAACSSDSTSSGEPDRPADSGSRPSPGDADGPDETRDTGSIDPDDDTGPAPDDTTVEPGADIDAVDDSGPAADGLEQDVDDDTDPTTPDADGGAAEDIDEVCVATGATATSTVLPVDVLWIVDNSLSMQEEVELISDNINAFASFIGTSGIDYRVVMLAYDDPTVGDGVYHVCVPPPLSGTAPGVCPTGRDVDGERYLHVREIVDSTNGLTRAIEEFPAYRAFLRPEAVQHIIVVSDDNAEQTASDFLADWRALAPWLADTVVHSIVTTSRAEISDPFDDSCTRPGCPCGFAVGSNHMDLSRATGGEIFSICEADWSSIFGAIAESVVAGTVLPCSYEVTPPPGELIEIDPRRVNVFFTPAGGARTLVPGVDSAADCGTAPGWYWPEAPATDRVQLCPASCGLIDGVVELELGCLTIKG